VEGKLCRADSNDHRAAYLQQGAQETLDAYRPAQPCRQRDPRFATPDRPKAPMAETFTWAALTDDPAQDWNIGPQGKVRQLEARRHKMAHHLSRRSEADAADCGGCLLREPCLQHAETPRKQLAVLVEKATETCSQQMIAQIDTLEARTIYRVRLASVEPVCGKSRSQQRLDGVTLRGKITVNSQWRLDCMGHNIEQIVHSGLAA
jgi:hypothetical protein